MASDEQTNQTLMRELEQARAEIRRLRAEVAAPASVTRRAPSDVPGPALLEDLREAQERIRKLSEESTQFRHLVSSVLNYAIFAMDTRGVIVSWNPGAERMKGWKAEDIIGRHLRVLYTPDDQAAGLPEQHLATALAKGLYQAEGTRMRRNGELFDALVSLSPIFDETGVHIGFSKVTQELTEQKKIESVRRHVSELERDQASRELQVAEDKVTALEAADVHKDQFLGILSHELRTPINAIMGFASVLDDELAGPLNPTQHGYTAKILDGAEALLRLINDLLDMSRVQAGKFSVATAPVDLGAIVEAVTDRLRPLLEAKVCRYELDVPAGLPAVMADELRIGQVFTNLIGNAIKYSPERCHVEVRVRREGAFVRCEVRDHGVGISAEDGAKLFKPFSQLDTSNTRRSGGVGLGLSIVKALIDAHGGQLGLESEPETGSVFWFTLPIAE